MDRYDEWLAYAAERLASGEWIVSGVHTQRLLALVDAKRDQRRLERERAAAGPPYEARHEGQP